MPAYVLRALTPMLTFNPWPPTPGADEPEHRFYFQQG